MECNTVVIHNFDIVSDEMIDGLGQILIQMAKRLNDPAERKKFEDWQKSKRRRS